MTLPLFLHLFFLGIWLGCVAVEAVVELPGVKDPKHQSLATRLHDTIDRWVELPTFTVVLVTGFLMFDLQRFHGWYAAKVTLGLLAILVNIYCVLEVFRRRRELAANNLAAVSRHSRRIYGCFIVGVPIGLAALAIGLHRLGFF